MGIERFAIAKIILETEDLRARQRPLSTIDPVYVAR
jgi:hypothetical protein